MSDPTWPQADVTDRLLRRLREPDTTASADFAQALLDPLVHSLRVKWPHTDDHLLYQAAGDTLLSVIRNPAVFDPARGNLPAFLRMAAHRDLANLTQREKKHHQKREYPNLVELAADDGNLFADEWPDSPGVATAIAELSDAERHVLDLMRDGERRTEVFAAALGIADGPEAAAEVKRVKDRIKARLKRARGDEP
jgi:hypothetical protein